MPPFYLVKPMSLGTYRFFPFLSLFKLHYYAIFLTQLVFATTTWSEIYLDQMVLGSFPGSYGNSCVYIKMFLCFIHLGLRTLCSPCLRLVFILVIYQRMFQLLQYYYDIPLTLQKSVFPPILLYSSSPHLDLLSTSPSSALIIRGLYG